MLMDLFFIYYSSIVEKLRRTTETHLCFLILTCLSKCVVKLTPRTGFPFLKPQHVSV